MSLIQQDIDGKDVKVYIVALKKVNNIISQLSNNFVIYHMYH